MAHPLGTDTSADRVEARLGRGDRDLRAQAWLTRDGTDQDRPGFDLGHLCLEQAMHERTGSPRNPDLRLPWIVLRIEDDDEHRLTRVQLLPRNLLLGGHHALDAPEVDVNGAALDSVHDSRRKLAPVLCHVAQHLVSLEVMDVTQHRMLRGLRGHALEVLGWQRLDELGAVRPHQAASHVEGARLRVELHGDETRRVEGAYIGGGERA